MAIPCSKFSLNTLTLLREYLSSIQPTIWDIDRNSYSFRNSSGTTLWEGTYFKFCGNRERGGRIK